MKKAREEILEKLKKSVHSVPERPDFDAPVYYPIEKPFDTVFQENMEKVNGSVFIYPSEKELFEGLKNFLADYEKSKIVCFEDEIVTALNHIEFALDKFIDIPENIEIGITGCEFLIAHTGSVLVSSAQKGGRQMFVYPPIQVIVAKKEQIVAYLEDGYTKLSEKYGTNLPSHIALITGPSRTADIEKTLVMGAHGPREVYVFLA